MAETIIESNVVDQYVNNMQIYSIEANRRRMVPDYKDGLKLVHRRILDVMFNYEHCISRTIKSMSIVGTTLKVSHPHGDVSVYDAMKPMVNYFEINKPLIDGQGNWGSIQGDQQAAARYTEAKLSQFALDCVISDLALSKDVVDWIPTYDGTHMEPEYLPVAVPLLLINGNYGIGVGLTSHIPRHNFNEVIDATLKLIQNPNSQVVLVPDQCMPCTIIDADWVNICNSGKGKYKVRGIIDIEQYKGKPALVIKSTPDFVFLNAVTDKIEDLIRDKKLVNIANTYDESVIDRKNPGRHDIMRYIIQLKPGTDPNYVREMIYKQTAMESTQPINFEVMDGIRPLRMSYTSYIQAFLEFRKTTKFRLYCIRLQKVNTRYHQTDAYIKVLQSGEIDKIIEMIKNQTNIDDNYLIEYLIKKLGITDLQAEFILKANIRNLSKGYLNKYIAEAKELSEQAKYYQNMITDENLIVQEIVNELQEFKRKYGNPRRCNIISEESLSAIPMGSFNIVVTENNYIKKVAANTDLGTFKNDRPMHIVLDADNRQSVLLFDAHGRVFKLPIHKIPMSDRNSNGVDIRGLIKNATSDIIRLIYEPVLKIVKDKTRTYFITTVTQTGLIKKMDLSDFLAVPASGITYIKLVTGDLVKEVSIAEASLDVILYSKNKALRINMSEIPHLKRATQGSKAMNSPEIDGFSVIYPTTTDIVVVTDNGKINRFDVTGMPLSSRNKAGNRVIKLDKTDSINTICGCGANDILTVYTRSNVYKIPVNTIPVGSSISNGSKMLNTRNDNIVHVDISQ